MTDRDYDNPPVGRKVTAFNENGWFTGTSTTKGDQTSDFLTVQDFDGVEDIYILRLER